MLVCLLAALRENSYIQLTCETDVERLWDLQWAEVQLLCMLLVLHCRQ